MAPRASDKFLVMLCCFSVVILIVMVDILQGKAVPTGRYAASLYMVNIINGTDEIIREHQDGFVFCFATHQFSSRRMPYTVVWTNPYGRPLMAYSQVDKTAKIFTVQQKFLLLHSYLVFRDFDHTLSGIYTCSLLYSGRLLARQTIHLRFFQPSFKVVPLSQCLTVPEGGSVLVPSPVVGDPPKPTLWSRLGRDLDLTTTHHNTGLLLQNVQGEDYCYTHGGSAKTVGGSYNSLENERQSGLIQGKRGQIHFLGSTALRRYHKPGVYRSTVWLGGGLIHHQDVAVSVLLQNGDLIEPEDSSAITCPTDMRPSLKTRSSVVIANELIADIQIHAYRRLVAEKGRRGRYSEMQSTSISAL
nr:uncharacterized protein LOC128685781 [Cherax quadricarinatus]